MATGRSGSLIFECPTTSNPQNSEFKINWSETYDIETNSSDFNITGIECRSPIWADSMSRITGNINIDGVSIVKFRIQKYDYGRVTLLRDMAWSTVYEHPRLLPGDPLDPVTATVHIPHNDDGTKTISVELTAAPEDNPPGYDKFTVSDTHNYEYIAFQLENGHPQTIELTPITRSTEPSTPEAFVDEYHYAIKDGLELIVLDSTFTPVMFIDHYQSLIWTVRYKDVGDFELVMDPNQELLNYLQTEFVYFALEESDRLMLPETWKINTDVESGDTFTISGRSLESILERRIVWGQRTFETEINIQDLVRTLMEENVLTPLKDGQKAEERKLWDSYGFVFVPSTDPLIISGNKVTAQYYGDSLLSVIKEICEAYNLGFRIIQNKAKNQFEFSLYAGLDRSYGQTVRANVVFSPDYDNLLTSDYTYDETTYRNVALVAGQAKKDGDNSVDDTTLVLGDSSDSVRPETSVGEAANLARYESFVDSGSLGRSVGEGDDKRDLTDEEYEDLMKQEGEKALAETQITEKVEATVDPDRTFIFGRDFFLGDKVQIQNSYGIMATSRVIEIIYSEDSAGSTIVPTFEIVDE